MAAASADATSSATAGRVTLECSMKAETWAGRSRPPGFSSRMRGTLMPAVVASATKTLLASWLEETRETEETRRWRATSIRA